MAGKQSFIQDYLASAKLPRKTSNFTTKNQLGSQTFRSKVSVPSCHQSTRLVYQRKHTRRKRSQL